MKMDIRSLIVMARASSARVSLGSALKARTSLTCVSLLLASSLGCEVGAPPVEPDNQPPVAQMWIPQIWHLQEKVPIDARSSFDPDGRIVKMVATFGDGNEEILRQDGNFAHLFPSAGSFAVRVDVTDDDGATSTVSGQVVVVERLDDPICTCELPCFAGGVCASGACFDGKTSQEEEEIVRDDVLFCEPAQSVDAGHADAGHIVDGGASIDAG